MANKTGLTLLTEAQRPKEVQACNALDCKDHPNIIRQLWQALQHTRAKGRRMWDMSSPYFHDATSPCTPPRAHGPQKRTPQVMCTIYAYTNPIACHAEVGKS